MVLRYLLPSVVDISETKKKPHSQYQSEKITTKK